MTTMTTTTSLMAPEAQRVAEERSRFRALLAVEASLVRAGRRFFEKTGDAALTCQEMLREHLTVNFTATEADLNANFDLSHDVGRAAHDRARVELALQRAALVMRKDDALQAIASRDDALLSDIDTDNERLRLDKDISEEERNAIEEAVALAWICRGDLSRLARMIVEQRAMQEIVDAMELGEFNRETLDALLHAAETRAALIEDGLQRALPLRRVLAADLALEASRNRVATSATALSQSPLVLRNNPSRAH